MPRRSASSRRRPGSIGEIEEIAGDLLPRLPRSRAFARGGDLHFLGIIYRMRIVGGELRDEVDGSTDTVRLDLAATSWRTLRLVELGRVRRSSSRCPVVEPRVRSTIGDRRRRPAEPRLPARPRRRALAAAAPPLRPRSGRSSRDGDGRLVGRDRRAAAARAASSGSGCRSPGGRGPGASPTTLRLRFVHLGGATNGMDVTWRIEPIGADGCRVVDRPRLPAARARLGARSSTARFTRPIAGRTLATFRAIAEALAEPMSPTAPRRRIHRHERRPAPRLDHRRRARSRAIGTGPRRVPGRAPGRSLAGQADRSVRPVAVPVARSPPRSTTSTRSPGCRRRPPASSTGSASSGSSPASSRSRTPGCGPGEGGRGVAGADRDLSRQRARRDRLRRGAARALPRARDQGRSRRTSPWRSSAAPRRRTSGSRSTSAGRSSRRRTRARPGAVAIGEALGAIRAGEIDAAIAGGVEIPLSPLAFGAFDIIRALSAGSNDDPAHACRPFDADRDGFVMGEGATLLVLEAEEVARARGAEPYAEVMGYGATSDALPHGPAAGRRPGGGPRGDDRARRRGRRARRDRLGQRPRLVDADRRHRRGAGDRPRAGRAARRPCPVSGTKALYGHPLGASGAIEAAICALAIRDGWVPASVNLDEPRPGRRRAPARAAPRGPRRRLPPDPVDVVRVRRAERGAGLRRNRRISGRR